MSGLTVASVGAGGLGCSGYTWSGSLEHDRIVPFMSFSPWVFPLPLPGSLGLAQTL
jgi:hypothetical protein